MKIYPFRAVVAHGLNGREVIMATDSAILAHDIEQITNDPDELCLPECPDFGIWLLSGTVRMIDRRGHEDVFPEYEPEYTVEAHSRIDGEPIIATLLAMSPPEEEQTNG